jgi:hypothetical protein
MPVKAIDDRNLLVNIQLRVGNMPDRGPDLIQMVPAHMLSICFVRHILSWCDHHLCMLPRVCRPVPRPRENSAGGMHEEMPVGAEQS